MKFTAVLLCLVGAAWGAEPQRRDTTTSESGFNIASLSSELAHITANATSGANFANISPPPKSLIGEIISVVPMTVIWELIDPQSRSSLASEFSAGTTPTWYGSLPSDVKSYMSVVRSQIKAGVLTQTTTPTTGTNGASQTEAAQATGATSTSSGLAPAQATGLTASVVGALSVLGLALAL
ncbi:hypothetical protein N7532_002111 [Penicillium argentinense]|uniref:Uncharacterized protein n=1 Tax=Penicillium argentinense TaxID=1131581 RepID=A0A9W9G3Z3_9EURO|nr:uncharacterized protein N7532_002111 [Penicillium argentinense]KAJ5111576.1 hypothetical protein N7532_002111 [Penicillium argentinense]